MQTLSEKILNGLQCCLPETDEKGMSDCISCPYNNCCDDETEVNLPVQMVEDIRALLKEQEDERKRIMKVIWDTLHEGLSIDTPPDQDWVYERIRHRIEDA